MCVKAEVSKWGGGESWQRERKRVGNFLGLKVWVLIGRKTLKARDMTECVDRGDSPCQFQVPVRSHQFPPLKILCLPQE